MKFTLIAITALFSSLSIGQTVIFSEDFNSGIPNVWQYRDLDGRTPDSSVIEYTEAYISKADPADTTGINLTASATSYFSPVGTANRWLITPGIQLGAYGNSFSWKAKSHDPSYAETYLVLASKTDDNEASFTDTLGFVIEEYADWTTRTANLSELGLDNETVFVAFILQTNDGFKFYIDDVEFSIEDPAALQEKEIQTLALKTIDPSGWYEIDTNEMPTSVNVHDAQGRLVKAIQGKTIDLRQEKSGVYFVQAEIANTQYFIKVAK